MSSTETLTPSVKWAQRKDKLYITVEVESAKNVDAKVNNNKLQFSCDDSLGKTKYAFEIELFKEVKEDLQFKVKGRNVEIVIDKKESGDYWPRLQKENVKLRYLNIDWNKWRDEDDEDDDKDVFDWSGKDDLPSDDSDVSDNDDIPPLDDLDEKDDEKKEGEKKEEEKKEEEKKEDTKMEDEKKEDTKKEEEKKEETKQDDEMPPLEKAE